MQHFVEDSRVIERLHQEPLSEHLASYASLLKQQGYARTSAQSRTLLVSRFGRWLERNGIDTYTVASQVFDVSFRTMPHYADHCRWIALILRGAHARHVLRCGIVRNAAWWRNGWDYSQLVEFGSNAGKLVLGHGVE